MQGFINVNKPTGVTSAYVVNRVKKHLNIKKAGHMGTLDPLASGVLPIAIGKATRMFDYFLEKNKQYIAVFKFGFETDTLDSDGNTTKTTNHLPKTEDILDALPNLTGSLLQAPPKYSAKKIKGRKAYELAREGVEFTLKNKEVEIFEFKLIRELGDNSFEFLIDCSSGTYIRSLARDLGYEVNSLATMTSLRRIESGFFNLENSISLNDFLKLQQPELKHKIIKINHVFSHYKSIYVNDLVLKKLKNGMSVRITEIDDKDGALKNQVISDENYFVFTNQNQLLGVTDIKDGFLKIKTYLLQD